MTPDSHAMGHGQGPTKRARIVAWVWGQIRAWDGGGEEPWGLLQLGGHSMFRGTHLNPLTTVLSEQAWDG